MSSIDDIRNERLKKLELLRKKGVDPYPADSKRTQTVVEVLEHFDDFVDKKEVTVSGRIMALRGHGGLIFADIDDGTAKIQGYLKADTFGEEELLFFEEVVDVGDFIELSGTPTTTKRGEKSVLVHPAKDGGAGWRMLAKSLRPLPEKWHGLQDTEERFRKRYLDILFNEEVREMVERRATFWSAVREFMEEEGFLEVQTPVLETTTGGADARPFETHHNALDIDVYLRISAGELWQKRLLVAGFPKVFEIGRIFRNEGISPEHFQDYTQMEFYWAYADYEMGMELTEKLFQHVAQKTWGTLEFEVNGHAVDLSKPWERYDYRDTIKKETSIDVLDSDLKEVETKLKELGISYEKEGWNLPRAVDLLWKYVRKGMSGPGFLVGVPTEFSPLAKVDSDNPKVTERFQTIIAGTELSNGYSELNDPIDQKERFEKQQTLREAGDEEAQMMDREFVEALEYGMPPACGFGMSERVFSVLSGLSAREATIFPLLRPRE